MVDWVGFGLLILGLLGGASEILRLRSSEPCVGSVWLSCDRREWFTRLSRVGTTGRLPRYGLFLAGETREGG